MTLSFSAVCGSSVDLETFWKFRCNNWISFCSFSISLSLTFLFWFVFDLFLLEDMDSWFRKLLMFNFFFLVVSFGYFFVI